MGSVPASTEMTSRFIASPWRDPRLILGIVLVLVAAVLGGLLAAAADHTDGFWATRGSVRAGDPVRRTDFVAVRAKVPGRSAATLLRTDRALPSRLTELRWAADARPGTLITSDSLAQRQSAVELPITASAGSVPADLRRGDRVDVWSTVTEKSGTVVKSRRILTNVRVVSRTTGSGIGSGPSVSAVVDVGGTKIDGTLMAAVTAGRITLVRVS